MIQSGANTIAVALFVAVIAITLGITAWAARHTRTHADFYHAGARLSGFGNGLAISGDFMSAATFLGITGMVFIAGFDAYVYILSPLIGLCIILFLVAEPLRHLGRFTVTDVAAYRLRRTSVQVFSAIASLIVVILYLVVQMIGAGTLIHALLHIPYPLAVVGVGTLMVIYVAVGGMTATTWVQITKAVLLMSGITLMSWLVLARFDFDFALLIQNVVDSHPLGTEVLQPGVLLTEPVSTFSLALALTCGFVGLPHILMRLFTVPNAQEARLSVVWAMIFISFVFTLIFLIVGYGSIPILFANETLFDGAGRLIGGSNMVSLYLAEELGGAVLFGLVSAVAFATILAVVSGLTLAGASAISHDLFAQALHHGDADPRQELRVSRIATIVIGIIATSIAILFEKQNIAYMVSMVMAASASAGFPLLMLALYWRRLTARGAVAGGVLGLGSVIAFIVLGPTVWVEILGHDQAIFPYKYPAIISMPLGLGGMVLFSLLDRGDPDADARFAEQQRRMIVGGASDQR